MAVNGEGTPAKISVPSWEMRADLAVHRRRRADDLAAERLADRLMAEADAEDRELAGGGGDQVEADAGLVRRARAGGQHDRFGLRASASATVSLSLRTDLALRRQRRPGSGRG